MNAVKKMMAMLLILMLPGKSFAHFESRAMKPMPMQMYWDANVNIYEAKFRVSLEPRYLDDQKKEFTYDLRVYQLKDDSEVLAYSEDNIGYRIYSMTDTGQWLSPFAIVSQEGDGYKVFRGLDFFNGKVKLGAKVKSARIPEMTIYPNKQGVVWVYSEVNDKGKLKARRVSYLGEGRWNEYSLDEDLTPFPWDSRLKGLGCDPL